MTDKPSPEEYAFMLSQRIAALEQRVLQLELQNRRLVPTNEQETVPMYAVKRKESDVITEAHKVD